jgi:phosphohistidine phosphatase
MLKEQLSELSTLRDVHVEMVRARRFLKELPEMKPFYDDLRSREGKCLKSAKKIPWKANRRFIETAVNRAQIKLNARRSITTADSARKIVETGLDVAFDGLSKKIQAVTLADYTTIHKVRLAFKPVRYTLETLQSVLPLNRKQLRNATYLSKIMGQIQDLEVLMKDLVEFGWKKESVLSSVLEIWLDLERRRTETAQRFIKAIPKFNEIWKPMIYEQAQGMSASKIVYVLRHGIAATRGDSAYPLDSDRPLTAKGIKRMRRVADGMRRLKVSFDVILTSPYKRALETAFVIGRQYGVGEAIQTCSALRAEILPEEVIRVLHEKYASSRELLLVGHEPQLSTLISTLTSGSASARPLLKKGGICKLQVDKLEAGKCATLLWLLTPRQLVNMA